MHHCTMAASRPLLLLFATLNLWLVVSTSITEAFSSSAAANNERLGVSNKRIRRNLRTRSEPTSADEIAFHDNNSSSRKTNTNSSIIINNNNATSYVLLDNIIVKYRQSRDARWKMDYQRLVQDQLPLIDNDCRWVQVEDWQWKTPPNSSIVHTAFHGAYILSGVAVVEGMPGCRDLVLQKWQTRIMVHALYQEGNSLLSTIRGVEVASSHRDEERSSRSLPLTPFVVDSSTNTSIGELLRTYQQLLLKGLQEQSSDSKILLQDVQLMAKQRRKDLFQFEGTVHFTQYASFPQALLHGYQREILARENASVIIEPRSFVPLIPMEMKLLSSPNNVSLDLLLGTLQEYLLYQTQSVDKRIRNIQLVPTTTDSSIKLSGTVATRVKHEGVLFPVSGRKVLYAVVRNVLNTTSSSWKSASPLLHQSVQEFYIGLRQPMQEQPMATSPPNTPGIEKPDDDIHDNPGLEDTDDFASTNGTIFTNNDTTPIDVSAHNITTQQQNETVIENSTLPTTIPYPNTNPQLRELSIFHISVDTVLMKQENITIHDLVVDLDAYLLHAMKQSDSNSIANVAKPLEVVLTASLADTEKETSETEWVHFDVVGLVVYSLKGKMPSVEDVWERQRSALDMESSIWHQVTAQQDNHGSLAVIQDVMVGDDDHWHRSKVHLDILPMLVGVDASSTVESHSLSRAMGGFLWSELLALLNETTTVLMSVHVDFTSMEQEKRGDDLIWYNVTGLAFFQSHRHLPDRGGLYQHQRAALSKENWKNSINPSHVILRHIERVEFVESDKENDDSYGDKDDNSSILKYVILGIVALFLVVGCGTLIQGLVENSAKERGHQMEDIQTFSVILDDLRRSAARTDDEEDPTPVSRYPRRPSQFSMVSIEGFDLTADSSDGSWGDIVFSPQKENPPPKAQISLPLPPPLVVTEEITFCAPKTREENGGKVSPKEKDDITATTFSSKATGTTSASMLHEDEHLDSYPKIPSNEPVYLGDIDDTTVREERKKSPPTPNSSGETMETVDLTHDNSADVESVLKTPLQGSTTTPYHVGSIMVDDLPGDMQDYVLRQRQVDKLLQDLSTQALQLAYQKYATTADKKTKSQIAKTFVQLRRNAATRAKQKVEKYNEMTRRSSIDSLGSSEHSLGRNSRVSLRRSSLGSSTAGSSVAAEQPHVSRKRSNESLPGSVRSSESEGGSDDAVAISALGDQPPLDEEPELLDPFLKPTEDELKLVAEANMPTKWLTPEQEIAFYAHRDASSLGTLPLNDIMEEEESSEGEEETTDRDATQGETSATETADENELLERIEKSMEQQMPEEPTESGDSIVLLENVRSIQTSSSHDEENSFVSLDKNENISITSEDSLCIEDRSKSVSNPTDNSSSSHIPHTPTVKKSRLDSYLTSPSTGRKSPLEATAAKYPRVLSGNATRIAPLTSNHGEKAPAEGPPSAPDLPIEYPTVATKAVLSPAPPATPPRKASTSTYGSSATVQLQQPPPPPPDRRDTAPSPPQRRKG